MRQPQSNLTYLTTKNTKKMAQRTQNRINGRLVVNYKKSKNLILINNLSRNDLQLQNLNLISY